MKQVILLAKIVKIEIFSKIDSLNISKSYFLQLFLKTIDKSKYKPRLQPITSI